MLYRVAHILQEKLPFLWDVIEWINSTLFVLRYGKRLKYIPTVLNKYGGMYQFRQATSSDIEDLVRFFQEQPSQSYEYFKPHDFDANTINELIKEI